MPTIALGALVRFGHAVAISDDTALVGAPNFNAGIADVFHRDVNDLWPHQARLTPTGGSGGPNAFGRALALHNDTAVVGAPTEDNGGFGNPDSGVAYVFVRGGIAWAQQARLVPGVVVAGSAFGDAIAIDIDRVLIGARDETVNGLTSAGAVHAFRRTNTQWSAASRIIAPQPAQSQRFGNSVALLGSRAAMASYWQTGVADDQQGVVQVMDDLGAGFVLAQTLLAPSSTRAAFNQFGTDVAMAPGQIVVGEPGFDGSTFNAGRGHVFVNDAGFVFSDSFE